MEGKILLKRNTISIILILSIVSLISYEFYSFSEINDTLLGSISRHHSLYDKSISYPNNNYFSANKEEEERIIPLPELLGTITKEKIENCTSLGPGFVYFQDKILSEEITHKNRVIPNVIHVTSRTRCITPTVSKVLSLWTDLPGYSVYFHDEESMDKLLLHKNKKFPMIQPIMQCINSGAGKADLWRYVLIYEYGGYYTDIDNTPGEQFRNGSIVKPTDDAFFFKERGGFPSQFFFAASRHHPILYYSIVQTIKVLWNQENINRQYVPQVSGPGAVKRAFINFMKEGYPEEGTFQGVDGRDVTILFNNGYLNRDVIGRDKKAQWAQMGMTVYGGPHAKRESLSCDEILYQHRNADLTRDDMLFRR